MAELYDQGGNCTTDINEDTFNPLH
jgi:hypothetical protein